MLNIKILTTASKNSYYSKEPLSSSYVLVIGLESYNQD